MTPQPPPAVPATATLKWSGRTDRGRVRPNNEDAFLALNFDGHEVRYLGKTGESTLAGGDFVGNVRGEEMDGHGADYSIVGRTTADGRQATAGQAVAAIQS